ncbi:intercellular adhesion molecule 3 isoform X1 [Manis javanica]|uniref:intercellular adhesion molecule 3 isoform X1 n=1 Tax=Manis javanica TaxID=9974 RepID=UPI000813D148|nr:intercellular adhesion molecule 3 isoform X1 [Manis javanica]KAI5936057.1 Intercellular adhesion molecule 3 [Manis javanica]
MVPSGLLPGACQTSLISLLLVCCLLLPGAQGQQFPLRVEPQDPVVPTGGSLLVNCTTNCPHAELLTLETSLIKKPVGNGMGWTAFQLSGVTGDSQVLCSGYCNGSQVTGSSSITVYGVPERVELAPLPEWLPVGENFTLRCRVEGGAPRTNLTVVLLRGEEELSRQPAVGEPAEVTATVRAGRDDHGASFSCRTELDLRPRGLGLFLNSSAPRQLQTFALTMPLLDVSPLLEVETSWSVDCILTGLFPASEAQVQVALGDQMLNATVESHGDNLTATATATASAEQEGTRQIVCNVTLGGDSRETRKNVTIYSFLGPILNLSEPTAPEGTTVTVTCAAGAQVQVTLDGISSAGPGQLAQLQLNATEEDDRRSFFCNATLRVDGGIFHRNRSVQLRVLYGPKIDRTKCPQSVTWQEKTTHVLQCQARGNPDPQLQCMKEGSTVKVPVGTPFFVKLKHNGTYSCRANSSLGEYSLTVVMNVQDRNPIAVSIGMGVLVILGLVMIFAALAYVFGMKKRSDSYHVNQGSTWLPLTSKQPNEDVGEEPS